MAEQDYSLAALLAKINAKYETCPEPLHIDSASFKLLDIKNMLTHLDRLLASGSIRQPLRDLPLWAKVWPASLILGRLLRKFEPARKSLLEIGCGMGALSLVASQYGFGRILATDFETDALDFARANVLQNGLEKLIEIKKLDLRAPGQFTEKFDFIAAAEILYLDDLHRPLLKLLKKQLAEGGKAFFCTDMARLKPHFQKLAKKDFSVQEGRVAIKGDEQRVYSILILERK